MSVADLLMNRQNGSIRTHNISKCYSIWTHKICCHTILFPPSPAGVQLIYYPPTVWQGHGCGWGRAHIATPQYVACLDWKLVVVERNNAFRDVGPEASLMKHQTIHIQCAYWHEMGSYIDVDDEQSDWTVAVKCRSPLECQPVDPSGKHHDIYGWVWYLCEVEKRGSMSHSNWMATMRV